MSEPVFDPRSNAEADLLAIINDDGTLLRTPQSRMEYLLVQLYNKMSGVASDLDTINGEPV